MVELLLDQLPALHALELQSAVIASGSPHQEREDQQALIRSIERLIEPLMAQPMPVDPDAPPPVKDVEAAKKYFESLGVKVVSSV